MRDYSAKKAKSAEDIRIDASQNRKALIVAARKLFTKHGAEIPLTDIAKAAGVSRPTFYRNFPDRQALIMAVFHYNLDLLENYAHRYRNDKDVFVKLLKVIANQQVEFHSLIPYLPPDETSLVGRVVQLFEKPVLQAKKQGHIREDFDLVEDLTMLIMMLGGALLYHSKADRETRVERALKLVMEGLKGGTEQ